MSDEFRDREFGIGPMPLPPSSPSFPRKRESIDGNAETGVDSRLRGNDSLGGKYRGNDSTGGSKGEQSTGGVLASASIPVATPEQVALKMTNPWILLKVKALGELVPAASATLEAGIDQGMKARDLSRLLAREFKVLLSELEVARYGGWLPRIRQDATRKAQALSEQRVQEAKERRGGPLRPAGSNPVAALAARKRGGRDMRSSACLR